MARVVVTGASSYTGACIATALRRRGHEVVGLCHRPRDAYAGLAARRLSGATEAGVQLQFGVEASAFPDWVLGERLDAWVHHHHPMENFRSEAYDTEAAEAAVLASVPALVRSLAESGARVVIHSSTYFEAGEGGQAADAKVTPYAELKGRVHTELAAACAQSGLVLSRVVIPAPTGALENVDRLTPQLLLAAERRQPFLLRSPDSVMDLLPGEELAESYAELVELGLDRPPAGRCSRPSGLVVSAGDWAEQVDRRLVRTLGWQLELKIPAMTERGGAVRFENPATERRAVDWDAFFVRYAAAWRGA